MTTIIINIVIVLLGFFDCFYLYHSLKELNKYNKSKKENIKTIKQNLQTKKLVLNKSLQMLKDIDLNTPLYASLTKEEAERFMQITEKLKTENEQLYIFANTLLQNVKIENLRNFMKNAPFIKIKYYPLKNAETKNGGITAGTYDGVSKTIEIYHDKKDHSTLHHELLHSASSDFSYDSSGFRVSLKEGGEFGEGLNEGYTELLNNRFFNTSSTSYTYLQKLAELIELFYENKEDMVEDYFNADIFGLIGELLKSMSLEEAIDIIVDMDRFMYLKDFTVSDYTKLKQKILKIYERNQKPPKTIDNSYEKQLVKRLTNQK